MFGSEVRASPAQAADDVKAAKATPGVGSRHHVGTSKRRLE